VKALKSNDDAVVVDDNNYKLCERPPQYAHAPVTFDLESGVGVTSDVIYLCANFSLPRPLCSRLRLDVRDRRPTSSDSIIA